MINNHHIVYLFRILLFAMTKEQSVHEPDVSLLTLCLRGLRRGLAASVGWFGHVLVWDGHSRRASHAVILQRVG